MTQRRDLGHTHAVTLKLHPDLWAHLEAMAVANYCSAAEYVRRLIVADMTRKQQAAARKGEQS